MATLSYCSKALKAFKKRYPNVTSTDLHTFILGFIAGEEIMDTIKSKRGLEISAKFIKRVSDNEELFYIRETNETVIVDAMTKVIMNDISESNSVFEVVTWPDIQDYMDKEGFRDNSVLINDDSLFNEFGSSAYLVRRSWLKNITL